jgi:hypothetical protein
MEEAREGKNRAVSPRLEGATARWNRYLLDLVKMEVTRGKRTAAERQRERLQRMRPDPRRSPAHKQ